MDPFTAILVPFAVGLATRFVWNKMSNYMQASKVAKAKAERLRLSVRRSVHASLTSMPSGIILKSVVVYVSFRLSRPPSAITSFASREIRSAHWISDLSQRMSGWPAVVFDLMHLGSRFKNSLASGFCFFAGRCCHQESVGFLHCRVLRSRGSADRSWSCLPR